MAIFTIKGFSGMKPILDPRLLQPGEAQLSKNVRIQSGSIVPYKQNGITAFSINRNPLSSVRTIYPVLPAGSASSANTKWLSWTTDVYVIESPVMSDQWNRLYWSGENEPRYGPKEFITSGAAPYPSQYYELGIPKPAGKPVAVGAPITEVTSNTREYAVTYYTGSQESSLGTTASTSCIKNHFDYGLYDLALSVDNAVATAVFVNSHDFSVDDFVKLTNVVTAFKVTEVVNSKTIRFNVGGTVVPGGATTASRRVMAKVGLSALPNTGNFQQSVTQKRIYRKKDGTWTLLATVPLAQQTYEDLLQDSEFNGSAISNAVLYTPAKPTTPPTAGYGIGDTSLADNASSGSPVATSIRVYAYSWVHDAGFESPLSDSSGMVQVVDALTRVKVTMSDSIPDGCSKKRIYRQDVAQSGSGLLTIPSANYKLVSEVPASQISYEDTLPQSGLSSRAAPTNPSGITPPEEFFGAVGTAQPVRNSETRVYVYTYVSEYGEEGPPSDPSEAIDIDPDFPVTITGFSGAPTGNYNVAKIYIYRTSTAAAGATNYQLVNTVENGTPVGQSTYTDKVLQSALGEVIPSIGWVAPPSDLQGLSLMANGIAIGWSDNRTLCFSEPYQPHAFPTKYQITVDFDVVGIAVMGQSAVILTQGFPYIVSGVDPASMTLTKLALEQACVSRRSIVEMGPGIMYASPDGLVMVSQSGADVVTKRILSQAQWQAYSPSSIHAYWFENRYHGFYLSGDSYKMFVFDPSSETATWTETDLSGFAAHKIVQEDKLYVLDSIGLKTLFGGTGNLTYAWKSKIAELPSPGTFSFGQVQADAYPVNVKITADGSEYSYVATSISPFRLQSGFMAREWVIEVSGTSQINTIAIAQSAWELKSA